MRLQNYYISDRECNPVDRDESEKIYLAGVVYGRSDIPDGSAIRTSAIASLNDKEAVTEKGEVYEKVTETMWICRNCGHLYFGKKAPAVCPVCAHPQSYFQVNCENY